MFWASTLLGVVALLGSILLYDTLPRPPRVALGLVGTFLVIAGVLYL